MAKANNQNDRILFHSWFADDHINVSLCNMSDDIKLVRVAVGTKDTKTNLYSDMQQYIKGKSVKKLSFPLITKTDVRGDSRPADKVFVYQRHKGMDNLIGFKPVQNLRKGQDYAYLENFITSQDKPINFRYNVSKKNILRILFIPKKIKTESVFLDGVSLTDLRNTSDVAEIKRLNLSSFYEKELLRRADGNFCYIFSEGKSGICSVNYIIHNLKKCDVVNIQVYRYDFEKTGSVLTGGGHGLSVMVYNNDLINIQ